MTNKKGKLILGYQGVGKTTFSKLRLEYIDLDSQCFKFKDGKKPDKWYETYVNCAISLAEQGYNVFLNTYKEVREYLNSIGETFYVICPSMERKDWWIDMLQNRMIEDGTAANKAAYNRAKEHYDEDIADLSNEKHVYQINGAWNLEQVIGILEYTL